MAIKAPPDPTGQFADRKRRTREHVLADLSVHHVEGLVLRCGYTLQRSVADYGYDLTVETYNERGEPENESIRAQLKASDNLQRYATARGQAFSFPVDAKDYRLWADALLPVLLILYDARLAEAYWLDVLEYAQAHGTAARGKSVRLHVPGHQVLGVQTFRLLRERTRQCARAYRQRMRRTN